MDISPLHPKLVHLPLALSLITPLVSGALALAWWRGWLPRRAWLLAAALQALLTLSSFAAMQSGETDEREAKKVVSKHEIHEHEEAAERFLWVTVVALALSLGAAVNQRERLALALAAATAAAAAASGALAFEVGSRGGDLVYQHGAARAFMGAGAQGAQGSDAPADQDGDHDESHEER
ncbi:MAG: hypothetical protein FJ138_03955 [Deltaproteobacteria bacterium]|nr:hypothetical protein [Deltaproteobacteria bacterium]